MKKIQLSQEKHALIDDVDYDLVIKYSPWYFCDTKNGCYARNARTGIYMHNLIMGRKWIDHTDGDGLNNQRSNLRAVNRSQNGMNRKASKNKTSVYKGVSKTREKWRSMIWKDKKGIYLGTFITEDEAGACYNFAANKLFGEYARLNDL